jgi:hypothetical protein
MEHENRAVHRTIVAVDVEGFGGRRRTNPDQVAVRDGLYRAMRRAFRYAGIPWADRDQQDRGDGMFILVGPEVPKSLLVESLPSALVIALRAHNAAHPDVERIRLRVALHAGEVNYDGHGVAGASVGLAFRLLESAPVKEALADSPGVLAVITSSWFFEEVVRHSVADTAGYRRVLVTVKETTTTGWVFLPDHADWPGTGIGMPFEGELATLAEAAAAALVTAMGANAWTSVRDAVAAVFRRGGTKGHDKIGGRLDDDASLVAASDDQEGIRAALEPFWRFKFRELVNAAPDCAFDLAEIFRVRDKGMQQAAGTHPEQHNAARDSGTLSAAQGGNVFVHGDLAASPSSGATGHPVLDDGGAEGGQHAPGAAESSRTDGMAAAGGRQATPHDGSDAGPPPDGPACPGVTMDGGGDGPPDRYLTCALPERAPTGCRLSLIAQITLAASPGASAPLKSLDVPPGGRCVTIAVSAPGLVPLGDLEQDLHVPAEDNSDPVRFGFLAARAGLHRVVVRAFASGTFLTELALEISVEAGAPMEEGPLRTAVLDGLAAEPGEVTLQVSRTDDDRYSFQLIGEALYPVELTRRLAGDPSRVVGALAAELRAMAGHESPYGSPALVRQRVRSLGAQLWAEVVPEAIRRQFWEQAGRIRLFSIASDMDVVPWELLYPIDGSNDAGFLVEQFPVVRRVYGQGRVRRLSMSSAAYIVPPGAPVNAMDEVQSIRACLGAGVRHQEVCSRLDELLRLLDDAPSLLHFACHNTFTEAAGAVISLDGGPLHPSDLTPARQARSMAAASPLVFLNACRTAGEIPGLMEMMGWARQFMGAGAGAFIGSLWAVRSGSAKAFADTFYQALAVDGQPLGTASLRARQAIAEDGGDPTWLAYTIYGNPAATIR